MSYSDDRLRGVGGWLAFLVISLMALGPVMDIVSTFAGMMQAEQLNPTLTASSVWTIVTIVVWAMALAQIAMMIYTGWRLNNVFRRSTVKFAIVMLWVIALAWNVLMLAAIGFLAGRNAFDSPALLALGRASIWAFLWTLYLLMSRRVQNTYDEEGPEVDGGGNLANVFE